MTLLLTAALALTATDPPDIQVGWASQYAEGVMQRVIWNRQHGCCGQYSLPATLPDVDGYVAVAERDRIGSLVWLRPVGQTNWELFLVADCAGYADGGYAWMKQNNILAEVDANTAIRWKTPGRGIQVQLRWTPPSPYPEKPHA